MPFTLGCPSQIQDSELWAEAGPSASSARFSNSLAYYGLAMDLQKFGLSVYLVQVLFGVIDIPAMLVATTTMIYVGRRATVASFLILAGLMVISNMFVPEGELPASPFGVEGFRGKQTLCGNKAEGYSGSGKKVTTDYWSF